MLPFSAASEPGKMLVETLQWKVSQCVAANFLGLVPVQMHGLFCCVFGGYPCQKCLQGALHSAAFQPRQGSEPRVQLLKILQCVCCKWVDCRILPCGKVQMLPFTAASEPGEMLAETLQWKVSQCVAVNLWGFAPVQMPGLFCCVFGGYPCQKCLQGTFAFRGIPDPVGI